ncbi:hypothetical protein SAY87_027956 [Trapa incisa]|uniref:Uncharacterized protein n=1 Tax=Trapa incisa TaxID=236973 RepID=A0AAN7QND8_9MYRT|nr:hypothetical protein SAY87_027956 [Trapa incisa]
MTKSSVSSHPTWADPPRSDLLRTVTTLVLKINRPFELPGNFTIHDFTFAAFLGAIPRPPDGSDFCEGRRECEMSEEREGRYSDEGYDGMHLQGLRTSCFCEQTCLGLAVPEVHKKFLADLVWANEEDKICIKNSDGVKTCRFIAIHAGLQNEKKAKVTTIPNVEALSRRKSVSDIPKELIESPTIVVSGHHGKLHMDGLRLGIDEGGGMEDNPVAAIILPGLTIVRNTGSLLKQ